MLKELFQLERAIAARERRCVFKRFHEENMHSGQPPILGLLRESPVSTQSAIAETLGVSRASVGVSLRRLEQCGYIVRHADRDDSRRNEVSLTEAGRQAGERADEITARMMEAKYHGFSQQELEQMKDFLERVQRNLQEFHP